MDRKINIDLVEYWRNRISDYVEKYADCLSFDSMPRDEFVEECLETITYYFDNDMLGSSLDANYDNIVSDTAKIYKIWTD